MQSQAGCYLKNACWSLLWQNNSPKKEENLCLNAIRKLIKLLVVRQLISVISEEEEEEEEEERKRVRERGERRNSKI